jgi:hypothetical protein
MECAPIIDPAPVLRPHADADLEADCYLN